MTTAESTAPSDSLPGVREWFRSRVEYMVAFIDHVGNATLLAWRSFRSLMTTPFDWNALIYQIEQLGNRSLAIATATSVFVGIVMTIQFAVSMEKFGAKDSLGRVIVLSEARELAPALTALVVGSRIAAGMAAELGSMIVTEQVDAIRALGADPIRKLVVPRLLAGIIIMPLISIIAFVFSVLSAMVVAHLSYSVSPAFFLSTALDSLGFNDLGSGMAKTPFFGFIIALLGCYFGLGTRGGTEGVGRSTTRAVVVVSITILLADALLTQIFISL